ncbi:MAG: permease [Chloroflexi bacterium]|nr:MAG: permease [Chloroflexota bacterium]MBL1193916.1 permease [Chloroflexota bacterium]NOH11210.1 permease [Chloroflexota bacterium]
MSNDSGSYENQPLPIPVSAVALEDRVAFIRNTYLHLAVAVMGFVFIEFLLFQLPIAGYYVEFVFSTSFNWLIILGLFMLVGNLANRWAHSGTSLAMQYMGLVLYVIAEAILFLPLLVVAANYSTDNVIPTAALLTFTVFTGLSGYVLISRADFSFLRMGLTIAGFMALGLIVASILFGFDLGLVFSVVMVGLASGYILYTTSNVLHHYRTDQYVAASLALFASMALMFWYILRILMRLSRR